MKNIITIILLFFTINCFSQSFLFSFNSKYQILNGDTLFIPSRIEVSNNKIKIYKDKVLTMSFDVQLTKQDDMYFDVKEELYEIRFYSRKKVLIIKNSKLTWKIE